MLINSGIALIVGNPESNSRTRSVGEAIAAQAGDWSSADVKAAAKTLSI